MQGSGSGSASGANASPTRGGIDRVWVAAPRLRVVDDVLIWGLKRDKFGLAAPHFVESLFLLAIAWNPTETPIGMRPK